MKLKSIIFGIITLLGICIVFYFSWLPNPDIGLKSYIPRWLGKWTNRNPNLRTAVPFIFLGFVGELVPLKHQKLLIKRVLVFSCQILIVTLAELGQLLLPLRHFDLYDIGWGAVGSIFGLGLCILGKKLQLVKS